MAGGSGTRFWPYSTPEKPKQFLDILGTGKTLLQQAFARLATLCGEEHILIISNARYRALIEAQLPQMPLENILYEPSKKNTGPCLSLCAHYLSQTASESTVIVIPADHVMSDEPEFARLANQALKEAAKAQNVFTFGIAPDRPHTGYGYIEAKPGKGSFLEGLSFHEKPDQQTAEKYVQAGNYFWNSGMFVWNNRLFLDNLKTLAPDIYKPFENFAPNDFHNEALLAATYRGMPDISIDHAFMEKLSSFQVVKSDLGWSDLGSWLALEGHLPKDANGNFYPQGIKILGNAKNCIFFSDEKTTFIAPNLSEMIIVQSHSGLLICPKNQEQSIKKLIEHI
jgi:mannose-1-phosphate guanylyltransferase